MMPVASKPVIFLGDSREALQAFPDAARYQAGVQLRALQIGLEPGDWKPMPTVGPGVREIRIKDASGAFRILYLATLPEGILVLHAFRKTTQRTATHDLELAARRLRQWKAQE